MERFFAVSMSHMATALLQFFMLGFAGETGTNKNFIEDEFRAEVGTLKSPKIWSDEKCLRSYKR